LFSLFIIVNIYFQPFFASLGLPFLTRPPFAKDPSVAVLFLATSFCTIFINLSAFSSGFLNPCFLKLLVMSFFGSSDIFLYFSFISSSVLATSGPSGVPYF
jgi:hypothetical protein